jgi:hypothetical protein
VSKAFLTSPVWPLWRSVYSLFPVWGWLTGLGTPGAWSAFGIDYVTGLRRNRSTQKTFDLLAGRADGEFEAVVALAELNARRQKQMFTTIAVAYVTIPLTLVATGAEVFPDAVQAFVRSEPVAVLQIVALSTLGALYYFASHWRARQIVEVLDLVRAERLAEAAPAVEAPTPRKRKAAQPSTAAST